MIKVLDFYADWCGPCKMMDPIIAEVETELKGKLSIEKINVDEKTEIAQKYGVMSIPTYVIVKDEKEIGRMIGYVPKHEFRTKLDTYLVE